VSGGAKERYAPAAMDRNDLERLDRDTLIARAEASGVVRARILTRPELIDELLVRASQPSDVVRVRGFFGRARDLLARVIERGLHLPDAAERLRVRTSLPPPPSVEAPLPTVTLAEIYAAQGHRERAVDTLRDVLDREPEHAAARKLIERLLDASYEGPPPAPLPPEVDPWKAPEEDQIFTPRASVEPSSGPLPATLRNAGDEAAGVAIDERERDERDERDDECVAIPVDRDGLFVHWEVTGRTRKHLESTRAGGSLVLRLLVIDPTWEGPASSVRDLDVRLAQGDSLVRGLPPGAVLRALIGWRTGDTLVPIAHSPALEALERDARGSVTSIARWTPRGVIAVGTEDRDAGAIERAFGAIREHGRPAEGVESAI
jgi:hypothetical protein